jgi:AcrR family transcriptional regulator
MTRKYEQRRRAEKQADTRRRIVQAAIELHGRKGPGRTTMSDVARLAGVERHTLYRHFPGERDLFLACSGLYWELNPPPDADRWRSIADPEARLRRGLAELYDFYARTEEMRASVLRDAEWDPLTREIVEQRGGPVTLAIRDALAQPLRGRRRLAALDVALDFYAWRQLTRSGLTRKEAVETMVAAVFAQ